MTGSGTVDDPFVIYDAADLQAVNADVTAYYELANDIDLTGVSFTPIGLWVNHGLVVPSIPYIGCGGGFYWKVDAPFSGHFDGKGFTISNLTLNTTICPYLFETALFTQTNGATIQNVSLSEVSITAGNGNDIATLIGYACNSTISNCWSSGSVTSIGDSIGGLIGLSDHCTVSECYSTCSINGGATTDECGGLVGFSYYTTFSQCYATGNVMGSNEIGGLIGYSYHDIISRCFSTGNVGDIWESGYAGGLIGELWYGTLANCYSTGAVSAYDNLGGFVACNWFQISMENCYSTGAVVPWDPDPDWFSFGGLIGTFWPSEPSNSFWDVETSGQATSWGGTGKTTAEMKRINTFLEAGWDIERGPSLNDGYPYLSAVGSPVWFIGVRAKRHIPWHPTEPNRGKVLSRMGSL